MVNKHPIVTGIILGMALTWGAAKLAPAQVGTLTGLIPMERDDVILLYGWTKFLEEKLNECQVKKGA